MKKLLPVLLLLTIISFSCKDEPQPGTKVGAVEMAFKLTYGDDPLVIQSELEYPDGKAMYFTRVSYYLSDVTLKNGETNVMAEEIKYCRLEEAHRTASDAADGFTLTLDEVPTGSYSELSFGIGVPADLNAKKPSDFPSSNDLSLSGEYWGGWSSYVFCKIEGFIDFDEDGVPEEAFVLHLGGNDALVNIDLDQSFTVTEGNTADIAIPIDLRKLFYSGDELYDIQENPRIHSLSQNDIVIQLSKNLKECF